MLGADRKKISSHRPIIERWEPKRRSTYFMQHTNPVPWNGVCVNHVSGLPADAEVADVAVFYDVVFAFDAGEGFGAAGALSPIVDVIFPVGDFYADEILFEIGVDFTGGDGRFAANFNGPGAGFLDAACEEGDQTEHAVGFLHEAVEAGIGLAGESEVFFFFFGAH